MNRASTVWRPLFVLTILAGSFLLFLVQPMVARMALPRLGGAPNVWNSAMLVYQALLLGGYAYAHHLGRMPLRRQATIHLGLLVLAAVTLPIALVDLPAPAAGLEALWVPLLLALSIGPVFLLVSAQAPLMQRWFAADPQAGEPWALYAASNLGSFAGLIAYPLLAEPLLGIREQSWGWSAGYALLAVLVAFTARARWNVPAAAVPAAAGEDSAAAVGELQDGPVGRRRILLWLALSAVPSGLMLSTTTHLTTDLFAMPLLWVIPLGLYLLSFVFAFADNRAMVWAVSLFAPFTLLMTGGLAMASRHSNTLAPVVASLALLFVLCVALHGRLYDQRPHPSRLTLFYFVMSAGGALGGLFTALIAPLVFDWSWEHPLLVLAAALLVPRAVLLDWTRLDGLDPAMARIGAGVIAALALILCWFLLGEAAESEPGMSRALLTVWVTGLGMLLVPWRALFVALLLVVMLAQGGWETVRSTLDGDRTRSYFGIYTVRTDTASQVRTLAHGTTLHGQQSLDPAKRLQPASYYGPGSGVGLAFANAQSLYGPAARIGVVGLGAGSLACYYRPGQSWTFYEIDPVMLAYSRNRTFTYLADCAPQARVVIGDARIELGQARRGSFDLLAIDAFSSDAIPLHLLTGEAFAVYLDALAGDGVLLVHISNRYIELEPAISALARQRGLAMAVREDAPPVKGSLLTPSSWVALARKPEVLDRLKAAAPASPWKQPLPPAPRAWSDDHASILPYIRWGNILGQP